MNARYRDKIIESMKAVGPTPSQKVIISWFESVNDESTALALSDQLTVLTSDQHQSGDYPWSLHGYAIGCYLAMILLSKPDEDQPAGRIEAYQRAIGALEDSINDWLKRVIEARAEAAVDTEVVEAIDDAQTAASH